MKLYLVRHGQTESNLKRIMNGPNMVLSPVGIAQAEELAKRFTSIPIDKMYCSTYPRAKQTAEILRKVVKVPLEIIETITEKKAPTSLLGYHMDSPEIKNFGALQREHRADPDWRFEDAENMQDVFKRATAFLEMVKKGSEQSVLAVTHGGFLRYALAAVLLKRSLDLFIKTGILKTTIHANTGITVLELGKSNEWEIVTWNDFAHLGDTHDLGSPAQ
jgi:broad specificity phosphatase PhoE